MKVMDGSTESTDAAMTIPPKKKKLIQALLPFQMLGSTATPNTLSNKKRKHMSPLSGECRSPKIVKIASKENTEEKKTLETSIDKKTSRDKDLPEILYDSTIIRDNIVEDTKDDESATGSDKKSDSKSETKPPSVVGIERFLKKSSTPRKDDPVVLLTRCDNNSDDGEIENHDDNRTTTQKGENIEKLVSTKSDESSNDELAKELEDSDVDDKDDDDVADKARSDASSDAPVVNTDTESEVGISSSDDERDEQKTNTENEIDEERRIVNGTSLDKTPTSSVKTEGTSAASRRLTPKQLEKRMETTKRREERRMERIEKEKKREEERLIRQKEKEARRREKKDKEEAEKEQKRKEKEQKELKKQMEIEQRQKEKERKDRAKEEDRKKREEAKEEEKRKKEEEKLEAERKKQKAASTFVSFFVPKKLETRVNEEEKLVRTSNFMPFEVKADMRVAPICRRSLNDNEKTQFDELCIDKLHDTERLYVKEIKGRVKRKSGKTWPPESKDDVVIIEEDDVGSCNMFNETNSTMEKQRAKLLAFAENRRPPYWGTWRKRSATVTPRRPFCKDTKWFDYDVDSDEEWEEEEPGESLRGSDDEKDEENPDDDEYDVDNEFMVPHGYLSGEEAQADEDEEDMTPETQKFKLKILGEEFEAERKTQTSKIKPKVIGCIWQGPGNSYPDNIPQKLVDFLTSRQAWVRDTPIILGPLATGENTGTTDNNTGEERRGAKKTRVPDEALPELIRLIHGNTHGRGFLIKEFMTFWNRKNENEKPCAPLSKSSLGQKIREFARRMACPEEGPMHLKACWYVSDDIRKKYLDDEILELPNTWTYALAPKRRTLTEIAKIPEKIEKDERDREKKSVPLITQFTKKITQEEMKKQLAVKTSQISSPKASTSQISCPKASTSQISMTKASGSQISSPKASTSQIKTPKRAQLISIGRGEQFTKSPIINAFTRAKVAIDSKKTSNSRDSEIIDVPDNETTIVTDDSVKIDKNLNPPVIDLDDSTDLTTE